MITTTQIIFLRYHPIAKPKCSCMCLQKHNVSTLFVCAQHIRIARLVWHWELAQITIKLVLDARRKVIGTIYCLMIASTILK